MESKSKPLSRSECAELRKRASAMMVGANTYATWQIVLHSLDTIDALRAAMPEAHRLRLLADWFDVMDELDNNKCHEVQGDLREWAAKIEALTK